MPNRCLFFILKNDKQENCTHIKRLFHTLFLLLLWCELLTATETCGRCTPTFAAAEKNSRCTETLFDWRWLQTSSKEQQLHYLASIRKVWMSSFSFHSHLGTLEQGTLDHGNSQPLSSPEDAIPIHNQMGSVGLIFLMLVIERTVPFQLQWGNHFLDDFPQIKKDGLIIWTD